MTSSSVWRSMHCPSKLREKSALKNLLWRCTQEALYMEKAWEASSQSRRNFRFSIIRRKSGIFFLSFSWCLLQMSSLISKPILFLASFMETLKRSRWEKKFHPFSSFLKSSWQWSDSLKFSFLSYCQSNSRLKILSFPVNNVNKFVDFFRVRSVRSTHSTPL